MLLEWKVNLTEKWTSLLEATMLIKFLLNNAGLAAWNMKAFLIKEKKSHSLEKYFRNGIRWVVLSSLSRTDK